MEIESCKRGWRMNSKLAVSLFLIALLVLSCTPRKSKEELARLNGGTPESFIQSVVDNRKDVFADSDAFEISGKEIFSKGSFSIVNFTEKLGREEYRYAVLLNPGAPVKLDSAEKSVYGALQSLLRKQSGFTGNLVRGNIAAVKDLRAEGSFDFVLDRSSSKGNHTDREQLILFYDGQNKLTPTGITAISDYEAGRGENNFTGAKETIEFRGSAPVAIVIHHSEDSAGLKSVVYDRTARWSKPEGKWLTGLVGTDLGNPAFKTFTQRLTYLEENDGKFIIPENCLSGGPIYFELKRIEATELSDYYLIETGIKDPGYNLAFQIEHSDPETYILYKARGEKRLTPRLPGEPEISRDAGDAQIIIRNDPAHHDIYWLTYSFSPTPLPYTNSPRKYKFVKCQ